MSTQNTGPRRATGGTAVRRGVTVVAATAAALAVWGLAVVVAGVDLSVRTGATVQQVGAGAVAVASLAAASAAWALLALLERFLRRPRRVWTGIAVAVGAVSLLGPLGAVNTAALVVLVALHLVVAVVLVAGLAPSAGTRG